LAGVFLKGAARAFSNNFSMKIGFHSLLPTTLVLPLSFPTLLF